MGGGGLAVDVAQDGRGAGDAEPSGAVDEGPQGRCVRSFAPYGLAQGGEDQVAVLRSAPAGEDASGGGAEGVRPPGPAAGPVDGGDRAHALEGVDGGVHDERRTGGHGALDQVEGVGIVAVGEVAQGRAPSPVAAVLGGLDDLGPVLGARHGGETAGCRDMEGRAPVDALLGPFEDGLHAPSGAGPGRSHLPLPAVETAGFVSGTHARGDGFAGVLGPQSPWPGLEGVPDGGGQLGIPLRIGGEAREDGCGEGAQARVVVPEGQLVEGPGPVGAVGGVPAQQFERVPPAVGGEVSEDGEGEAGA